MHPQANLFFSQVIKEDFIIFNMTWKLNVIFRTCIDCQSGKVRNLHTYMSMQNKIINEKREMVVIDFLGLLSQAFRGTRHILVCVDVFT